MTDWILSLVIVAALGLLGAAIYRTGRADQTVSDLKDKNDDFKNDAQDFANAPQSDDDFSRRMRERIKRKD